jgi:hypothetical protein
MYTGLCANFMPYWLQSHPHYRVETLELGVSDIDIFQIQILRISYIPVRANMGLTKE